MIHVFAKSSAGDWAPSHTVRLPDTAEFKDYSDLAISGRRIAVVSQRSKRLWVGELDQAGRSVTGPGSVYRFPGRDYCNVEGIAWLSADRLIAVSDRRKKDSQRKSCSGRDQSIHRFEIPSGLS